MNFKTTSILALCLAIVGGVIFFTRGKDGATDPAQTSATDSKKLLAIVPADVATFTLAPADGTPIAFTHSGNDWALTAPITGPADSAAVQSLVSEITELQTQGQTDISDGTGLAKPRFVITLTDAKGGITTLNVGDKSGVGDRLYVKLNDNAKADVVAADVADQLDKSLDDFRDRQPVHADVQQIQAVEMRRPQGDLRLTREGDKWRMTAATTMPASQPTTEAATTAPSLQDISADASAVTDLLIGITSLRGNGFEQGDVTARQFGLAKPTRSVTLSYLPATPPGSPKPTTSPTPQTVTLLVGNPDSVLEKNVYITTAGSGAIMTVPKSSLLFFEKTPLDLKDKLVLDLDPANVSRVTVTAPGALSTRPSDAALPTISASVVRRPPQPPATMPAMGPMQAPPGPVPTVTSQPIATMPAEPIAGTQPTTQASTLPSSLPTTVAASEPATKPAPPPTAWMNAVTGGPANDSRVAAILSALHPLRTDKFVESAPAGPNDVTVTIESGGGGVRPISQTVLTLHDAPTGSPDTVTVNGVSFQMPHSFAQNFSAKFDVPGPPAPAAAPSPAEDSGTPPGMTPPAGMMP